MGAARDGGERHTRFDSFENPGAIAVQFPEDTGGGFPTREYETARVHVREQAPGDFAEVFDDHRSGITATGHVRQPPEPFLTFRPAGPFRGHDRVPSIRNGLRDACCQSVHLGAAAPFIHDQQRIEEADGRRL